MIDLTLPDFIGVIGAVIPFPQIDPAIFTIPAFEVMGYQIGPLPLRWYALAYIAGLALGWFYVTRLVARDALWPGGRRPMEPAKAEDLLFWMTLGVVLGGRLGFVLFYQPEMLLVDPAQALRIWEGGMAFHGGMLGAIIAVILFSKNNGVSMLSLGDAVACATPIGLFFGRIANFINGELWGRVSDVPWAMVFPSVEDAARVYPNLLVDGRNLPRHPSQLYEAALEGVLLFAILGWLAYRSNALKRPGFCVGVFLLGYGVARFAVEFFRQYDPFLGFDFEILGVGVTRGQTLCLPMMAVGAAFIYFAMRRKSSIA